MFTGLITDTGKLVSLRPEGGGASLEIKAPKTSEDAQIGDSISINGACLTITSLEGGAMRFHVSGESLKATTLGELKPGDTVNLEPALRPTDRMGGHFVTGHVDSVGRIRSRTPQGQAIKYEVESPAEVLEYLVDKGSVTVDGISLTVVEVLKDSFTLVIIPHTADITTLGSKAVGARVNLEADIIGKYVHRYVHKGRDSDDDLMNSLRSHGFTGGQ
jgi:riboflavin synthase